MIEMATSFWFRNNFFLIINFSYWECSKQKVDCWKECRVSLAAESGLLVSKVGKFARKIGEERKKIGSAIIWVGKPKTKKLQSRQLTGTVNVCKSSIAISDKVICDSNGKLLAGNFQIKRKFLMKNSWVIVDLETTRAEWIHKRFQNLFNF